MLRLTNNFSLKFPEFLKLDKKAIRNGFFVYAKAFLLGAGKIHFLSKAVFVLFLVLFFSTSESFGQRDQITTQAGEKIRCRILDETATRFVYAYIAPNGKVLRNEIFKNLVTDFKYDFYPDDIITKGNKIVSKPNTSKEPTTSNNTTKTQQTDKTATNKNENTANPKSSEKVEAKQQKPQKEAVAKEDKTTAPMAEPKTKSEYDDYLKFRVGVRGGFGNMLTKLNTEDQFGLYQEKLLRGWTWGADFAYFPTDNFGFGIMFNNFQSKNSADNINFQYIENGELVNASGSLSNKRSTKFVGPVAYFRKSIDFKTMVILGLAPGAYFYNDKGSYKGITIPYKGWNWGGAATLGIDFLLGNDITGRDIILSLEAGYNYGKISSMDFSDGKGPVKLVNAVDLSRLDFTVGLRFMRYPRYFKN
ncbi:autotransporter outer membrane beta-barrel domain-containing protein [Emticicia soli]|uniref:Autotransporter outer membrane beta-barrel domain-containing protein n=1 Tax=Emticicia soli TaxID=2027878 RepID=A0ABW5J464_9BACT